MLESAINRTARKQNVFHWQGAKLLPSFFVFLIAVLIWISPHPEALSLQVWHLFAIFFATIFAIITLPLPVGAIALFALSMTMLTGTLNFQELSIGYVQPSLWMLTLAFFLADGLIKTNLAMRIAYLFISVLGHRIMGLSYGIIICELILAPFIPSIVVRSSCVIFPIVLAIGKGLNEKGKGYPGYESAGFLILVAFHSSVITSAMFLTSMAGNPLIIEMARDLGINITWGTWALASFVPGTISLSLLPWIIYKVYPPDLTDIPKAPKIAKEKLQEMGPISFKEWIMCGVFLLVLSMWLFGEKVGIDRLEACFLGVSLLLFFGIITWDNCLKNTTAWNTFFWLGAIIGIGTQLKNLGLFDWAGENILRMMGSPPWQIGFLIIAIVYFYTHYFFAGNVAHITSMYMTFLATALKLGAPPLFAALILAFLSNLFGGLTHYGTAPALVYFSSSLVSLKKWWKVGFVCGTINLVIWIGIGSLWLKIIGFCQ